MASKYEVALMSYYPEEGAAPYHWKDMPEAIETSGVNFVSMMMDSCWVWNLAGAFSSRGVAPFPKMDGDYVAIRWLDAA